jgi:hypothetical protein
MLVEFERVSKLSNCYIPNVKLFLNLLEQKEKNV